MYKTEVMMVNKKINCVNDLKLFAVAPEKIFGVGGKIITQTALFKTSMKHEQTHGVYYD